MNGTRIFILFVAALLLCSCSGVVSIHRVQLTPRSAAVHSERASTAADAFLLQHGYRHIRSEPSISFQGVTYGFVTAASKFRGGEFRVYVAPSGSAIVTAWYAYVPPLQWDSSEYHSVSTLLFQHLAALPDFSSRDITFDRERIIFNSQ